MRINRWKMNRVGFINFWLYDEEIFELKDGKILIRGSNGSGKSITTQSIVSFMLDGDRSPERLDPFSSKGRKMEYYFLQDGEKDDQTGYIFLELKKEETDQYITLGIGQRARQGKSMDFWGFVLSDGRRIGEDLELYRKVGDKKIPLTEKEMENKIGDKNKFASTQKEYIKMINKELFGFSQINYYEKLINFLLKIRTSKLSTGIKPVDVYQMLRDSLQVLEDEDLRVVADTLEIMDNMQRDNEKRQEAKKSLDSIKKEYDKYNRFILWKKATTFNTVQEEYKKLNNDFNMLLEDIKASKEVIDQANNKKIEIKKRKDEIEEEIKILDSMDLKKYASDLSNLEMKIDKNKKDLEENYKKLEEKKESLKRNQAKEREEKKKSDEIKYSIEKHILEMEEINEILMFEYGVEKLKREEIFYEKGIFDKLEETKNNLKVYSESIEKGLELLTKLRNLSNEVGEKEEKLNNLKLEKEDKEAELQNAIFLESTARDNLIESFYFLKEKNEFLKVSKNELDILTNLVKKYTGLVEAEEIKRIFEKNYNIKKEEFQNEIQELKNQKNIKEKEYVEENEELRKLKNMSEKMPERDAETIKCREELKKAGIKFLAFYETVDFKENLTIKEKNILENQLKNIGILDALVIAEEDREKAIQIIEKYNDKIITVAKNSKKTYFNSLLIENIDEKLKKVVEEFLNSISSEKESELENSLILTKDGYFKNGRIEGYSNDAQEASFIGENTRKLRLERIILAKEEKCAELFHYIEEVKKLIQSVESKILTLKEEYNNIPKFDNINTGIHLKKETEMLVKQITERFENEEEKLNGIKNEKSKINQEVISICKVIPQLGRNVEEYSEANEMAKKYMLAIYELESRIQKYSLCNNNILKIEEIEKEIEENIEFFYDSIKKIKNDIEKDQNSINKINEILNTTENIQATENLKKLEIEKNNLQNNYIELEKKIEKSKGKIEEQQKNCSNFEEEITKKQIIMNKAELLYKEELNLGYVLIKDKKIEKLEDALKLLKEREKEISLDTVNKKLLENFNENKSILENYMIGMEDIFEEDPLYCRKRSFIRVIQQGKKFSLYEFEKMLEDEIIQGEMAIEKKDKELILDILTGNIGHKINSYIYESKMWVKDMSKIMLEMETSMDLKFSLDWKAKEKLDENELNIEELESLLRKDVELLPIEDLEKISKHFKNKLKLIGEEVDRNKKSEIGYMQAIKKVLDYREWFDFKIYIHRVGKVKKELTNSEYNKFSGGEKAMSIYIPLLAAASAQYKKAKEDCPRIIALDEAFAGIDDKNINSMFKLIEDLDFDYIMNSQQLWGCYDSVKKLAIAELINMRDIKMIMVNRFLWNGKNKILE